jgi:hypothetical protein
VSLGPFLEGYVILVYLLVKHVQGAAIHFSGLYFEKRNSFLKEDFEPYEELMVIIVNRYLHALYFAFVRKLHV